jgi:hypothetical protein
VRDLLVASLGWWMARTPPGDRPAPGAEETVLGACRALVWHRSRRWLAKAAAGRQLLEDGDLEDCDEAAGLIEQAIAARAGGPPPSGGRARVFQQQALRELADGRS